MTASPGCKRVCSAETVHQNTRCMTALEFEARIIDWARQQPDLEALIQIGSRAQASAEVDEWSDWDYQLIVRSADRFQNRNWPKCIASCWNTHLEQTERAVLKLSVVFEDGREADFVPLTAWQIKLVYLAMRYPQFRRFYPRSLTEGIYNTRLIVRPGYKILIGGLAWKKRLDALQNDWPVKTLTIELYQENLNGFWRHAVWVYKKVMRGELRAALRWMHIELTDRRLALLAEEARLVGKTARPEARKAEQWLDARRLEQTAIATSPDQLVLAKALLAEISLFEEVSRSVAASHGFVLPDHSQVAGWLRAELQNLSPPD